MAATIQQISQLWPKVSRRVHDRLRAAFRDSDLPPLALGLLRVLREQPGQTVSGLGRRTNVAKSYISRTVEQLVNLGYVERRTDDADQRLIRLYVTDAADTVTAELAAATERAWAETLSGLSAQELETVAAGLHVLLTALADDHDEGQETSTC